MVRDMPLHTLTYKKRITIINVMNSQKGFVFIAVILALSAFGISLTVANLSFFVASQKEKEEETREEIKLIVEGIRGNSKLGTFGYIGDMGRLPNTLSELNTIGTQTAFHNEDSGTRHFFSVGMGWNGIYVPEVYQDSYIEDAWGGDYSYTIETVAVDHDNDASTATVNWRRAQITSSGADKTLGTDDDINSEYIWESGAIYVSPRKAGDFPNIPGWADHTLYFTVDGGQSSEMLTPQQDAINYTDGEGNTYEVMPFSTAHHGPC